MGWLRTGCLWIVTCVLGSVPGGWAPFAHAQDTGTDEAFDYDEVFFSLRHNRAVDAIVNALYDGEHFYLSLQDLFDPLQLDLSLDVANRVASGFYLDDRNVYEVRFAEHRARIGRRVVSFDSTAFVQTALGFFLRPALIEDLFDFSVNVDLRSLSLTLDADHPFPVDKAIERERARRFLGPMHTLKDAPLLFDRRRALLRGGVVGYSLGASSINNEQLYSVDLNGGVEVLGGDMQGNIRSIFGEAGSSFAYTNVQWRYVPRSSLLWSQAKVGEVSSRGLRPFQYRGAQLSNAPVQVQRIFGYQRFEGQTEPGWEVELLINNRLVDFTQADETGHYAFAIPISYGTTLTTIRMYGPTGQFEETTRRLQVPISFVPVGKLYYDLDVGQTLDEEQALAQFGASMGLLPWLTASVGTEYLGSGKRNGLDARFQALGEVTARLLHHHLVSFELAPGALYRGSINAFYPSLATVSVEYTRFLGATPYNQSSRDQVIEVQSSFPLQLAGVPINVRLSGRQHAINGRHMYTMRPGFSAQFARGIRVNATYQLGATDGPQQPFQLNAGVLNGGLTYAIPRQTGGPRWLHGMLTSIRFGLDTRTRQFHAATMSVSRNIGSFGRLRITSTYNVNSSNFATDVQFSINVPTARATTTVRRGVGNTSISQDVSGAIGWDIPKGHLVFERQNWVGSAAAAARMFVDGNGNDTYDEGEQVIQDGALRFRQALRMRTSASGVARFHNLRAYERYHVVIDKTTIRNPLWVPKVDSFSFVTDPNAFKQLDIPFYVSGVVEGSVLEARDGGAVPIPGLRVHLWSANRSEHRMLPVFRDGQFFEMELRPGDYIAVVDSSQLAVLGMTSTPPVHPFTVRVTEDGDWISGLDFKLRRNAGDEDTRSLEAPFTETLAKASRNQPAPSQTPQSPSTISPSIPDSAQTLLLEATPPPDNLEPASVSKTAHPQNMFGNQTVSEPKHEDKNENTTIYIVQRGDKGLMDIARKVYRDDNLWVKIWIANEDVLQEPDRIQVGQRLLIPKKAPLTSKEREVQKRWLGHE